MKKNYFLRTAILLVALLSGASTGWAVSLTQEVIFNDWSKVEGSGTNYASYQGEQIFPGSDGIDYTWNFVASVMRRNGAADATELQLQSRKGILESPTFETEHGFTVTITYTCSKNNASITETGTSNTVSGASPLSLTVSSLSAGITINAGSAATYISQITITPTANPSLQDPALAFTGITGDVTKMLTDGSYSSAATTASDATIVYSSSNQEVATIGQDGLVTLVASGTTTIKAEVAETATYNAAEIEYTLTVFDPATVKTFAKVTSGAVTDGQYILVYQESDDATSVIAMNTTNEKDYFMYTEVNLTDGKIVTDDQSIIWDITTQANGSMSISNGDNIFVGYKNSSNNAYIYETYTEENCDWTFKYEENVFSCTNGYAKERTLKYNNGAPRFACYTSAPNITLYKLDEGKQAVTVAFNEVSGDKEVFFTESFTYNSAATATPERPITYSSSNQEVATISTEGIVTVAGPGTTIIKATTEGNDTYEEGAAQYTLTVRAASVSLPYSTDFKSGLGEWLTYVTYGTTEWESTKYGAQANGFNKGDGETYLVSPAVSASSIVLSFGSEVSFTGPAAQLFYSSNFDPSTMTQPAEATWTEITDMATWASSQETTPSGDIELKNLTAPIRFAFKYTCSEAEGAARWTITDLSIKEGVASGIETVEANGMKIINGKGQVTIETAEAAHVAIYALTGAQVRQIELVEGTNVVELPAGIYVIGHQKVVVF